MSATARISEGRQLQAMKIAGRRIPAAAVVVGLFVAVTAAVWGVVGRAELNYDITYALTWGHDVITGNAPDFDLTSAPTPHPLTTVLAAVFALFGDGGSRDLAHLLVYVSLAGVLVCTFLIARELGGLLAAVAAVAPLLVSRPLLTSTAVGFQDVTATALVLLALLLELRRPRNAGPVLIVLAIAGLVRPEIWLLSGAYWLFVARDLSNPDRVRFAGLVALGPIAWFAIDGILTGEPLHSLTATRDGAAAAGRVTGAAKAPRQLFDDVRGTIEVVVPAGALVGAVLALRRPQLRDRALVTIATGALLCLSFLALGVARLSLLERYVLGISAVASVLFAVAVTDWIREPPGARRLALLAGAALLVVGAVYLGPRQIDSTRDVLAAQRTNADIQGDLRSLAKSAEMRRVTASCGTPAVSSYRMRPDLALALDHSAGEIPLLPGKRPATRGALVTPGSDVAVRSFIELGAGEPTATAPPPPAGHRLVSRNASWALYARGC